MILYSVWTLQNAYSYFKINNGFANRVQLKLQH